MAGKVNYQAIDNVIPAHTVGDFYDLVYAMEILNQQDNFVKNETKSLSGFVETNFVRTERTWEIKASFLPTSILPEWQEFFYSTKIGEEFKLYLDSNDSTFINVAMATPTHAPARFATLDSEFSFTFTVRENI